MRALRSRNVQSDSESNEQIMEEAEHGPKEIISKKEKQKKSKKHTSDCDSTEHLLEDLKRAAEKYVSKKVKQRKSKKHTSDRVSNEHMIEDSEHGTETEATLSKKVKRKKLKKRTSDTESNEHLVADSEHGTETEETLSKKVKRKKSKKRTSDTESNKHLLEDSEHGTETGETLSKKVKRKKSKKRTSDTESNEHLMEDSEHGTETEGTLSKKVKRKKSKKSTSDTESNEHMMENSEHGTEYEALSKKIKRKISKKHISVENNPDSDEEPEEKVSKKKSRKLKERTKHIEDNSTAINQTTETVLNTSTESQQATENPAEKIVKKMSRKPREFLRSTILNSPKFDNVVNSTAINQTTEAVVNIITEPNQIMENSIENITKKTARKPREFLRSTIFNSPKFDNVITSTAMKPKRPEIKFEGNENEDEFENKSSQQIIKLNNLKSEQKSRRQSKIGDDKIDNRRETFIKLPRNKVLNETDENIVQSKITSLTIPNTTDSVLTGNIKDCLENDSSNKSIKQESIQGQTATENTLNSNRESVSNRRETFNKMPKNQILNGIDSVIAISDSPELSKLQQNYFNKSNLTEPEVTSDEEMITDDSLEQSSLKTEENKNKILLAVENTIITISDTPERTNLKQNTFNKSETQEPEITSDEDSETIDSDMKQIPKKINVSTKSKTLDLSLNRTNLKTQNDSAFTRRGTFCKTPIKPPRKSEKIFSEINNLSVQENNKEHEGLSDVSESILEDIIDISDSPEKTKLKQSTFNLSSNSANNTINKSNSDIVKCNGTFELKIVNTSGDWQVEKNQVDSKEDLKKLNDTFEVENKENNSKSSNSSKGNSTIVVNESNNITIKNENLSFSPPDKSIRKKWLKFSRNSSDAQTVLDQISSPILQKKMNASKIVQKIMSTPTNLFNLQKLPIAPSSLSVENNSIKKSPKSFKKSPLKSIKKSPLKSIKKSLINGNSTKKSATKRTAMPNFAKIHKNAYEKMENLKEYSERKNQRAQMLLSSNKAGSKRKSLSKIHKDKTEESKLKSSRQLFTNNTNDINKYNRFGFKVTDPTKKPTFSNIPLPNTNVVIAKPVIKPSVFARSDVVAIANKNKVATNIRENRRDMMKGVRTNRRFELLMQMRNK